MFTILLVIQSIQKFRSAACLLCLHLLDETLSFLTKNCILCSSCQIAAGTLDASAKIYAVRVDVVHADAYKVLGGLGKDLAPTKNADSPEGGVPFTHFLLSSSSKRDVGVLT